VADRTESFLTDAHGRDHITTVEMAVDADNKITGLKVDTVANLGAYMSLFSSSRCRPISTRRCCRASTHPGDPLQRAHGLHQHRAGRRLSRRGPSGSDLSSGAAVETAARELGVSAGRIAPQELHPRVPAPDAGHHVL
jgi:hypothetical protein